MGRVRNYLMGALPVELQPNYAAIKTMFLTYRAILEDGDAFLRDFQESLRLGIGKVAGLNYPWPEAAVTSLFIPVYINDLPKTLGMRAVGGIHWALIACIGVGMFLNYFRRRLGAFRSGAIIVSERLADQSVREKMLILENKFGKANRKK
jgi:hypothetical protein